jgi:hypothetical protein
MTDERNRGKIPFFFRVEKSIHRPFGFLAETYGARIKAQAVVVTIRIGDNTETFTLDHVDGSPYKIQIWNIDPNQGAEMTEYDEIMKIVADPNGKDVDLKAWVPYVPGPPAHVGMTYCHPGECSELCTHDLVP